MAEFITWGLTSFSLLGNYLNCRKRVTGFRIWIACNLGWMVFDIIHGVWARVFLGAVQTAFCIYGLIRWTQEEHHGKR